MATKSPSFPPLPAGSVRAWITPNPIDTCALLREAGTAQDGAVLLFVGTVRQLNEGRSVVGIRYEAYKEMAEEVLTQIAQEAENQTGATGIHVVHRIGELAVGDVSVAIVVATPHRAEAFTGARYIIEEIKQRLPVWKHEHYADGSTDWVAGTQPRVEATRE